MIDGYKACFGLAVLFPLLVTHLTLTLGTANAEPLVTVSCDVPKGFNIAYGTTLLERAEAREKKQPTPPPALSGPNKDGYSYKPTFVIDANRKDITVVWAETAEDIKIRTFLKEQNITHYPPPPATVAAVALFMPDQISAIESEPWSIMTYSFFPKLGTVFIGQQTMSPGSKDITELATFAHCEFSWTNPNDSPAR
jgi:hypothetical protein